METATDGRPAAAYKRAKTESAQPAPEDETYARKRARQDDVERVGRPFARNGLRKDRRSRQENGGQQEMSRGRKDH